MNSRFKALGFGKRRSTASIQAETPTQQPNSQSGTPPPAGPPSQIPPGPPQLPPVFANVRPAAGPAPSIASTSSQQSLPMNHPGAGPRPPSYTANYPPQGGPPPLGRQSPLNQGQNRTPPSQMIGGPPPINTGAQGVTGYPPPMGGPPPGAGGPPGYAGAQGYPPPGPPQPQGNMPLGGPYQRSAAAEVEGNSRSKAQLIVGIDFVSKPIHLCMSPRSRLILDISLTFVISSRAQPSPASPSRSRQTTRQRRISLPNGLVLVHTQNKR